MAGEVAEWMAAANEASFNEWLYIDGDKMQRWLLKTVINVAAAGWAHQRKWRPSDEIVSAIYGYSSVPDGLGLYSVDGIDPRHRPQGGISVLPLIGQVPGDPQLMGAYVGMHGLPMLCAFSADLASRMEAGEIPGLRSHFSQQGLRHQYRPGGIVSERREGKPVVIGLSWGGLFRYADGTSSAEPPADRWKRQSQRV